MRKLVCHLNILFSYNRHILSITAHFVLLPLVHAYREIHRHKIEKRRRKKINSCQLQDLRAGERAMLETNLWLNR